MRALLDTHALIWWLAGDGNLSKAARTVMEDEANVVFVSAASGWEIATKVRIGKIPSVASIAGELPEIVAQHGFTELPISLADGVRVGFLPGPHRDPFDRMLIAQAQAHDMPLISNEVLFDEYRIRRIW